MNEELGKTPQGQMKQLGYTIDSIKMSIGRGLMSAIQAVLPYLQAMANVILKAAQYFQALMSAIFGTAKMSTAAAGAASAVADAQIEAGDAAEEAGKKAKGSVAGFDEINQLAEKSGGDSGTGNSGGSGGFDPIDMQMPEIDTETIPAKVQEMVDKVKGILSTIGDGASSYGKKLKDAFSGIGPALKPIIDAQEPIKKALGEIGETAARLKDEYLKPAADYILLDFVPSIVTSFVESFAPVFADIATFAVEEFAKTFENATTTMIELWNNVWKPALEDIKAAFLDAFPPIADTIQSVLDDTIKPFVDYILNDFIIPISAELQETFVPIFTDIFVWAIGEAVKQFQWLGDKINEIYETLIKPVFDFIKKIVLDCLKIVQDLWKEYGERLLNNISDLMENIRKTFDLLWTKVLKPIIEPFLKELNWLWDKHLKGLVEEVGKFVMKLVNGAIHPIVNWLIEKLGPVFATVFSFVADVIGTFLAVVIDVVKGILKALGGVIDFIVGLFTGNWELAWQGIKDIFSGIWDGIVGIVKGAVNLIIDLINVIVRAWNGLKFEVPNIDLGPLGSFGGWSIGLPKIPEIPKLARGGIIDSPTLAMIGEAGKEAVVPLENTSFVNTLASAVGSAVMAAMQTGGGYSGGGKGGDGKDVVLSIDGTPFARVFLPYLTKEQNRIGASSIIPV